MNILLTYKNIIPFGDLRSILEIQDAEKVSQKKILFVGSINGK